MRTPSFGAAAFVLFSFGACSPSADPPVSSDHHALGVSTLTGVSPPSSLGCQVPSEGVAPGPVLDKSTREALTPSVTVNFHLIGLTSPSPVTDQQVQAQLAILNQNYQGRAHFELGVITRNQTSDENWYWNSELCTNEGPLPLPADLAPLHSHRTNVAEVFLREGEGGCSFLPWLPGLGGDRDYTYVPQYPFQGGSGQRFFLTHELGHWLGLWHTHQNGCSAPGDEVDDTPPEAIPSADCPAGRDTCPGGGPDPVRNYMDHGENCASELTPGQFARVDSLWYLRDDSGPSEGNDAHFVAWSVPDTMEPNQVTHVWIDYENTGGTTWTRAENYALGSQNPPNNTIWGLSRVAVPHDVPPRAVVRFEFDIRAPNNPANYHFRWRPVQDGAEPEPWFGERTPDKSIEVGGGGPCPPNQAPTTVAPKNFVTDATPDFDWMLVPGATAYTLYVQYLNSDDFVIPGVLEWPAPPFTPSAPLPVGDDLRWKVRGVCNGTGGPYSQITPFHILFGDVPEQHPSRRYIEGLYRRPRYISENCGLDAAGRVNFCPGAALLRKNAARWLLKAKFGPGHVPPPARGIFLDVPAADEFAPWIEELAALGITAGCGGGNFCPNRAVTRAEATVLFLLAEEPAGYRPPTCWIQFFDDVPCSAPMADWINEMAWRGIAFGCGGGNFCSGGALTREDASTWIHKLFFGN